MRLLAVRQGAAFAKRTESSVPSVSQGMQWSLLKEEDILPRILALDGRRGRALGSEGHQPGDDSSPVSRRRKGRPPNVGDAEFSAASNAKLLRKLEAQGAVRRRGGSFWLDAVSELRLVLAA